MTRFWIVQAIIIVAGLLLVATTLGDAGATRILEHRTICSDAGDTDPCWITFGGYGAIEYGVGAGLVSYGWVGAGILFGVGQATTGLIAFGQVGIGPVFFCSQLGAGLQGIGQLAIGGRVKGQGQLGFDGGEYLKDLSTRLNEILKFR